MINTPTSDTETEVLANGPLRRDHPVLHSGLIYGEAEEPEEADATSAIAPGAAYEGYSGLDVPYGRAAAERKAAQTLRDKQDAFQEMLRGWASL